MPTASRMIIGVIAGAKATDALLCRSLERAGFTLVIAHGAIPPRQAIPWLWKRIRERGFSTLVGHLLLAIWLRIQRGFERMRGISPWDAVTKEVPSWRDVASPRFHPNSETELIQVLEQAPCILMLDAFRFSHRFFRRLKRPCLQIVWGSVPGYLGDSAGYWAYVQGDPVEVTVIERGHHFDKLRIMRVLPVPVGADESLRSIKIKQAAVLASALPRLVASELGSLRSHEAAAPTSCRFFYAPTFWHSFRRPASPPAPLPAYAFRDRPCLIEDSSLTAHP